MTAPEKQLVEALLAWYDYDCRLHSCRAPKALELRRAVDEAIAMLPMTVITSRPSSGLGVAERENIT